MIPNWLSRLLEALPGTPYRHVQALMAIVLAIDTLDHIFNALPLTWLVIGLITLVLYFDFTLADKEILDLRDWVVARATTSVFFISVLLWIISRVVGKLAGGEDPTWWDYAMCIPAPYFLYKYGRIFLGVLENARQLPNWQTTVLIKRRDIEGNSL